MERKSVSIATEQLSLQEERLLEQFRKINGKEPEMASAISEVIEHVAGTYEDKYAKGQEFGIDTKQMLYNPEKGDLLNVYQMSRYLQRYISEGSRKSHLVKDLMKIVHYSLFEIVRRLKVGDGDPNDEPKV